MTNTRKAVRILKDSPSDVGHKTPLPKSFFVPERKVIGEPDAAPDGLQLLNRTHPVQIQVVGFDKRP
jgi:hypothetical protein